MCKLTLPFEEGFLISRIKRLKGEWNVKKFITSIVVGLLLSLPLLATATETIKVGVTPGVHEEIMEIVAEILAEQGIKVEIITFQDYVTPNLALAEGEIDVNSYQHEPFLRSFVADRKVELVKLAPTISFPIGLYSRRISSLDELRKRAVVAIPNDPTNGGRVLVLMEKAGLIKLKPGLGIKATVFDIVENPRNLIIKELDAAQLPRALEDVDIAAINTNYAIEAGLNPVRDSIYLEGTDSPYVNILAVRKGDENKPLLQALVNAYHSQRIIDFVTKKYEGSLIPGF